MPAALRWASDYALLVAFGDEDPERARRLVLEAIELLRDARIEGLRNVHPAYASVLVASDPLQVTAPAFEAAVRRSLEPLSDRGAVLPPRGRIDIPVCYAPEHAPDLELVASAHGLSIDDVIRIHFSASYVVSFLGFTPGFPYLAGLPEILATPRMPAPRNRVAAGSVAIGGSQAGIYPFATPGGWRIIGRTPLDLFVPGREPPALLSPGDPVRFVPIDPAAFQTARGSGKS